MNTFLKPLRHLLPQLALVGVFSCSLVSAQDAAPNAKDIAGRLSAGIQDGSSFVKLRMEVKQPAAGTKVSMNLYLKARRTQAATDIMYQMIYPKERKGEAFLLRKASGRSSGLLFVPPAAPRPLSAAQMKEGIFSSDISYEDVLENFFAWENQAIVGAESVGRAECQILESKPGKGDRSSYSKVRSWIDLKKMVPMRVEKYSSSGQLAKRIDTTDVKEDDINRHVTRGLVVQRPGHDSVTELEGTEMKHGVVYADGDFSAEGLQKLTPPKSK